MRFHTVLLRNDKTATGIRVPDEVVDGLGQGKRPPVRVTINGYTYRSSIAVMGGEYMLGVSAEVRERSGVAGGDEIDVDIELDTEPREVALPEELAAVLAADPDARRFFDGLSYSNRRRLVEPIDQAKTPEARQRRLEKAIASLRDGRV
jgi:hypothetical protein